MYDIQWIFDINGSEKILNRKDLESLKLCLHELLDEIDDEIILKQRYHDKNLHYNILIFKHGQMETEILKNNVKKKKMGMKQGKKQRITKK